MVAFVPLFQRISHSLLQKRQCTNALPLFISQIIRPISKISFPYSGSCEWSAVADFTTRAVSANSARAFGSTIS